MSLTESAPDVERLASFQAWSGWNYAVGRVGYVEWSFGFAGLVTEGIAIAQSPAPRLRGPQASSARGSNIAGRLRGGQTTAIKSEPDALN